MSNKTEYSRLLLKRSTIPFQEPTIPTGSTIDNTWLTTDLLVGEGFLNAFDDRLWYRTLNGIIEVPMSGFSSSNYYTESALLSGTTIIFNRNDTPVAYSVDLATLGIDSAEIENNASSGRLFGGGISLGSLPGTINIGAGGGMSKDESAGLSDLPSSISNGQGSLRTYVEWDAIVDFPLAGVGYNLIYWDASLGAFNVVLKDDFYTNFDFTRDFTIGRVYYDGTTVLARLCGMNLYNFDRRVQMFGEERFPVERTSGLLIGNTSPSSLQFDVSSGILWAELVNRFPVDGFTGGDTFTYWYRDGVGGHTSNSATTINNLQYDNNTGSLATLTDGNYGVHWVYVVHDSTYHVVYGIGDYNLALAQESTPPTDLPGVIESYATLVGKIIVQKGVTTFHSIQSPFITQFQAGSVSNHNELAGLQGGTTNEYFHLTSPELSYLQSQISTGITFNNIYNVDGTLTANRTVSMEDTSLTFDGGLTGKSDFIITAPLLEATFTNKNVLFEVEAGSLNNYFNFDDTRSNLGFINPLNNQFIGITVTPTQVFVGTDLSGLTGFTGVEYVGDYSANFVNRSLVDKEYVDNAIPIVAGVYLPLNVTSNTQVNVSAENLRFIATGASEIESYVLTNNQKKSILVDNTTASLFNQASDLSQITYFVANNTQAEIAYSNTGGTTSLGVESNFVDIGSDVTGFQGAIYNGDYSTNFVPRSLVDKAYVDNQITGITQIYDVSFALSDETTQIVTSSPSITLFANRTFTATDVKLSLSSSGSTTSTVDVFVNGVTILTSPISLTSGNRVTTQSITPVVIVEDDVITVDITAAGTGATGAKIYIKGNT